MFSFSTPELVLILVIALVVFGPGKLPEVGKAVGKSLNEFKRAMNTEQTNQEPVNIYARSEEHKDVEKEQKPEEKK